MNICICNKGNNSAAWKPADMSSAKAQKWRKDQEYMRRLFFTCEKCCATKCKYCEAPNTKKFSENYVMCYACGYKELHVLCNQLRHEDVIRYEEARLQCKDYLFHMNAKNGREVYNYMYAICKAYYRWE
jgi:hypothetical protein